MFQTLAKRLYNAPPYLGIGVYYFRPDGEACAGLGDWTKLVLTAPLILSGRQADILIRKYGTDSTDYATAMAGAWILRREVLDMGRDGIVARNDTVPIRPTLDQGSMTIVHLLGRSVRIYDPQPRLGGKGAQIFSFGPGGLLAQKPTGASWSDGGAVAAPRDHREDKRLV